MSNIPKKSCIAKPQMIRITSTDTSRIPGTNSVHTESRTIERVVPGTGEGSCQGACSTTTTGQRTSVSPRPIGQTPQTSHLAQPQSKLLAGPQMRQLPAPKSKGLLPPQAKQLFPTKASYQAKQPRLPQPSQLAPPQSGQLAPPQIKQLPAPQPRPTKQLAAPQIRQLAAPQIKKLSVPQTKLAPPQGIPQPRQLVPPQAKQAPAAQTGLTTTQFGQVPGPSRPLTSPQARKIPQPGAGLRPPKNLQHPQPSIPCPSTAIRPSGLKPPTGLQRPQPSIPCPSMTGEPASRQLQQSSAPSKLRPPSGLRPPKQSVDQTIRETMQEDIEAQPDKTIVAKGKQVSKLCSPEIIQTPSGPQRVIQKAVIEKRIERDETGERIVKNIALSDLDEQGITIKTSLGIQQFDPQYPKEDGGREVLGVTSTVSVTPSYKTISKESNRVTVKPNLGISPQEVALLVEEEKEDVENTLKMVPADIILEPGNYEIKKRQQRLRLHSESMALLEQSIIQPVPTADESLGEPAPEVMARMMDTVEKGISPQSEPDEVFNSLFETDTTEQFIKVSSITPGPLQDVVIPTEVSQSVHMEAVTENMTELTERMNTRGSLEKPPEVDLFTRVMSDEIKSPTGKSKPRKYQALFDEKSLWVNANMEYMVNVIGAEPAANVDPYNLEELMESGKLEEELANGIDYFVEADPIQYMSRVQLRGTQMPPYFPGYMVALPDFPELVKIAKTPDEVYASAWKAVQPKYFGDESMLSTTF